MLRGGAADIFPGNRAKPEAVCPSREAHQGVRMRCSNRRCLAAVILLAFSVAGCGGGGSGTLSGGSSSSVTITISPGSASVGFGATFQFTAGPA